MEMGRIEGGGGKKGSPESRETAAGGELEPLEKAERSQGSGKAFWKERGSLMGNVEWRMGVKMKCS